jgi:putative flippase GtrA
MKIRAKEFLGYFAASACALAVDFALLRMLVDYCSWWYLAAATVSFSAGLLVTYALSVAWIFEHRRIRDRKVEFAGFAALGALGAAVNAAVMLIAVKYLGLYYLVAKGLAACFTFVCNFISRRQLLFTERPST